MIVSRIASKISSTPPLPSCREIVSRAWSAIQKPFRRRRVPVILQMTQSECGAACLAMILNYHGRKTRLFECREHLGAGTDGVKAHMIAQEARRFGLRVRAYSVPLSDFSHVPLPAVVYWDFNHFIVVEKWSPKQITVADPAVGRRKLTYDEFDEGFTGVVLTFEPGVRFEKRKRAGRPTWRQIGTGLLRIPGIPRFLIQILGASIILQVLGLSMPLFTKVIVDEILPRQITDAMFIVALGMLILVLAQVTAGYLRSILLMRLKAHLDPQMMLNFFEHVLTLPYQFFQTRASGDLLMRLRSNSTIRDMLTIRTLSALLDGVLVIGYLGILFAIQPIFALIALALGIVQISLLGFTTPKVQELMRRDLAAQADSQSYLVETLSGIAALKASGTEDRSLDKWSNLYFKELGITLRRDHLSALVESALTTVRALSPLALLWVGAIFVLNGQMTLGTMLAINALGAAFLTPLASLVRSGQALQVVGAYLDRLADVLEAEPEQDLRTVRTAPRLTGKIELRDISFRYSPNSPVTLHGISLTVEPGQKVALVGPTGSGKSTLAKICMGLYLPDEGEVLFDDIPIQTLRYPSLRNQFGVVMQDPFLFSGSIRDNIAFNEPTMPLESVTRAAKRAAIHDEVLQMLMGYETGVGEGGARLSGGQLQRVALARAVAHNPVILIMDEATSHLDAVTERIVDRNLNQLSCTRIVIAHRLSTIRNADQILVLKEGKIVERGTHAELMALNGFYSELVHIQIEDDTEEDALEHPPSMYSNGVGHSQDISSTGYRESLQIYRGGENGTKD